MRNSPSLALLLALMLLFHQPVAALNWQGTGELNNDNLTVIWNFLNTRLTNYAEQGLTKDLCTDLSNALNAAWDPAWNVVVVKFNKIDPINNDVILYGYAFNNHWMWFNGYVDSRIPSASFSFVIWKDYNCQVWNSVGSYAPAGNYYWDFTTAQKDVINGLIGAITKEQLLNDPWNVAKTIIDGVQASSEFVVANNHAFTIILAQDYQSGRMDGRVCTFSSRYFYSRGGDYPSRRLLNADGVDYGTAIIIQTR